MEQGITALVRYTMEGTLKNDLRSLTVSSQLPSDDATKRTGPITRPRSSSTVHSSVGAQKRRAEVTQSMSTLSLEPPGHVLLGDMKNPYVIAADDMRLKADGSSNLIGFICTHHGGDENFDLSDLGLRKNYDFDVHPVKDFPMPVRVTSSFALHISQALLYLERRGMTHRDVCAKNVFYVSAHDLFPKDSACPQAKCADLDECVPEETQPLVSVGEGRFVLRWKPSDLVPISQTKPRFAHDALRDIILCLMDGQWEKRMVPGDHDNVSDAKRRRDDNALERAEWIRASGQPNAASQVHTLAMRTPSDFIFNVMKPFFESPKYTDGEKSLKEFVSLLRAERRRRALDYNSSHAYEWCRTLAADKMEKLMYRTAEENPHTKSLGYEQVIGPNGYRNESMERSAAMERDQMQNIKSTLLRDVSKHCSFAHTKSYVLESMYGSFNSSIMDFLTKTRIEAACHHLLDMAATVYNLCVERVTHTYSLVTPNWEIDSQSKVYPSWRDENNVLNEIEQRIYCALTDMMHHNPLKHYVSQLLQSNESDEDSVLSLIRTSLDTLGAQLRRSGGMQMVDKIMKLHQENRNLELYETLMEHDVEHDPDDGKDATDDEYCDSDDDEDSMDEHDLTVFRNQIAFDLRERGYECTVTRCGISDIQVPPLKVGETRDMNGNKYVVEKEMSVQQTHYKTYVVRKRKDPNNTKYLLRRGLPHTNEVVNLAVLERSLNLWMELKSHPNIVALVEYDQSAILDTVTEYFPEAKTADLLPSPMSQEDVMCLGADMCAVLDHLSQRRVVCGQMSLRNILATMVSADHQTCCDTSGRTVARFMLADCSTLNGDGFDPMCEMSGLPTPEYNTEKEERFTRVDDLEAWCRVMAMAVSGSSVVFNFDTIRALQDGPMEEVAALYGDEDTYLKDFVQPLMVLGTIGCNHIRTVMQQVPELDVYVHEEAWLEAVKVHTLNADDMYRSLYTTFGSVAQEGRVKKPEVLSSQLEAYTRHDALRWSRLTRDVEQQKGAACHEEMCKILLERTSRATVSMWERLLADAKWKTAVVQTMLDGIGGFIPRPIADALKRLQLCEVTPPQSGKKPRQTLTELKDAFMSFVNHYKTYTNTLSEEANRLIMQQPRTTKQEPRKAKREADGADIPVAFGTRMATKKRSMRSLTMQY